MGFLLENRASLDGDIFKLVRWGDLVGLGDRNTEHADIAGDLGLGEVIGEPGDLCRMRVNDAGWLVVMARSLKVYGRSGSCLTDDDSRMARDLTGEIVARKTGMGTTVEYGY